MKENCRELVNKHVESRLPRRHQNPIKGTKLVAELLAMPELQRYSESSIRYTLTMLSQDATSCIEKCSRGQGYHLRPASERGWGAQHAEEAARIREASEALVEKIVNHPLVRNLLDVTREAENLKEILSYEKAEEA